ncbi:Solute carrier family 25 member 44 [Glycine soja]
MASSEINWDRLDKKKFFVVGAGLFTGVTAALYPVSVVKTRLQVASKDTLERSAFSVVKGLLKTDGIPGLYKGFGTVIIGAIPTRIIFLTALETTKVASFRVVEPFRLSETTQAAIANGIAGMASSFLSQTLFVPIDVVSQKLMVQGLSGHAQYSGGLDVARKVLRSDGIRGLYRGFGLSVMTYVPSNVVWWASYGSSQRYLWRFLGDNSEEYTPSLPKIIFAQATGGIIAGATASCITNPLDTIKTRLQVLGLEKKIPVKQVVKDLIAEDGWKGVYRGLGPRLFSTSAWGTSMILAYEYLSKNLLSDFIVLIILFVYTGLSACVQKMEEAIDLYTGSLFQIWKEYAHKSQWQLSPRFAAGHNQICCLKGFEL